MLLGRYQPFEWIVASRFLREGRLQSLFIMFGVAIGVAVIVFMSALLQGLQNNLVTRVLTAQPHIQILPSKEKVRVQHGQDDALHAAQIQAPLQRLKSIDQWPAVLALLRAMPEVSVASPAVAGSTFIMRGAASRALNLTAVDLALYQHIVNLREKVVAGQARLGASDILIGIELAADLGVRVGDKLLVQSPTGVSNHFMIAGILDLGSKGANQRSGFVSLHSGQSLLGYPGGVTSIDVTVRDVYAAEVVAQRIQMQTQLQADSWIKTNAQFFSAVKSQSLANTAIRFFVGLSVAFGIASVLVVSVVQKQREIGILRAMGATQGQVLRIFLLQGAIVGALGSALGVVLAVLLIWVFTHFVRGSDGLPLFNITLEPALALRVAAIATVCGVLAAVAPARRAARLDPAQAIRL